jgi:beta-glucosidase
MDSPAHALDAYPGTNGVEVYKEGLLVGYRWFDTKKIEPLFPFGYGLSYTKFEYSGLKITPDAAGGAGATVEFELRNTGDRAGAEVAEVYVQPTNPSVMRPVKELKSFAKVMLKPGEQQTVSVHLDQASFSFYDPDKKGWVAEKGDYKILVGASSRNINLTGDRQLAETAFAGD